METETLDTISRDPIHDILDWSLKMGVGAQAEIVTVARLTRMAMQTLCEGLGFRMHADEDGRTVRAEFPVHPRTV
jgi:hypothetical protein